MNNEFLRKSKKINVREKNDNLWSNNLLWVHHSLFIVHRFLLAYLLFFAFALNGFAQQTISVDNFLKDKIEQHLTQHINANRSFNSSWIEQIDFRTETDEFDFKQQRYNVRISPSSPKIRKAQKNLHQLYQEKSNLEANATDVDFIEFAYQDLLQIVELSKKIKIKKELLIVLNDQEKVYAKLLQVATQSPKDWLDIQQNIAQLKIDIYQHEAEIASLLPDGKKINYDNLIAINQLKEQFQEVTAVSSKENEAIIEKELIEGEIALEKAEQKKVFDFLQIQYRGPNDNPFEEKISLTAAFQFPFSGKQKLKLEELAIEKETLEREVAAEKRLKQYKVKEKIRKIGLLITELEFTEKTMLAHLDRAKIIVERNNQNADNNPLFLLYQKEEIFKKQLDFLKLEMTIYQEYIEYLALTESLFQEPFYNYLTVNGSR